MNEHHLPPAQLWIGSADTLTASIMDYLQKQICSHGGCGICLTCTQIRTQQHHAVIWICPEKQYTLDDLDIIHERLSFSMADNEHLFFILQKADYLSKQCANSLLKSIEEPPKGYHFILCAERIESILPTVQSRCIVRQHSKETSGGQHQELFAYFTGQSSITPSSQQPLTFFNFIQKCTIHETESIELIDQLFAYWMQKYTQALCNNLPQEQVLKNIMLLKEALLNPPMSGSSKLFWKNLYTQFYI
jgi:DNA polymerase III gamma/tau subunit